MVSQALGAEVQGSHVRETPTLGLPLHPLVVHFPIVLSVLLPIAVLAAACGWRPDRVSRVVNRLSRRRP
jgi:hypothetical protein